MKRRVLSTAALLLSLVLIIGCGDTTEGQTPAEDDVALALPEAGLVEAWAGEMAEEPMVEEETGAHTERNDIYDENGVLCGYDVCEYDELDRVTLEEQFDMDGNCTGRWERRYSEDGRECETLIYSYGELTSKIVTNYDEQGVETEYRLYDNGGALLSMSYFDETGAIALTENYMGEAGAEWKAGELTYGENGSVEERGFSPDGSITSLCRREYDEMNREVRDVRYEDGAFCWDYRLSYDERGFCVRRDSCDENGELLSYELMEYTPEGFCCVEEDYSAAGILERRECWEYAEDGRVLSRHYYNGEGQLVEYTLMEYAEDGRILREQDYDAKDEPTTYREYRYAADGSYDRIARYANGDEAYRDRYDAYGYYIG